MKKAFYFLPFLMISILVVILTLLFFRGNCIPYSMYAYVFFGGVILISAALGINSPTKHKFDYLLTAIIPLSFFVIMGIVGFCSEDDLGTRYHLRLALRCAFHNWYLIAYAISGTVAFITSYETIRIKNRKKRTNHKFLTF